MNVHDFRVIPLIPMSLNQFLARGHFYSLRLPRKFKKHYKSHVDRQALHLVAHDFIRQLKGI